MGVRGEIFSKKIILPNRSYFFNIKENRMGDIYLNIVESKNRETGGFDRQSIVLFAEDLQEFLKGFDESLQQLEDLIRNQRRGRRNDDAGRNTKAEHGAYPPDDRKRHSERDAYPSNDRKRPSERDAYPHNDRKRTSERDSYPSGDRKRSYERDTYPRNDRKKSFERDGQSSGRKRSSERDTYPPGGRKRSFERDVPSGGRKRTSERDTYTPSDRKRSPKGQDHFDRSGREGKRIVVRKPKPV